MAPRTKTIEELKRELGAKERLVARLQAKRAKVAAQLKKIDSQIATTSGAAETKPRRRRRKRVAKAKPARRRKAAKAKRRAPKKAPKRARRRRATGAPLAGYLRKALAGKEQGVRVRDLASAVVKAGYKTYSKDFYGIVATALRDGKEFKKLGRGVYALA